MNGMSWGEQHGSTGPFHLSSSTYPCNSLRIYLSAGFFLYLFLGPALLVKTLCFIAYNSSSSKHSDFTLCLSSPQIARFLGICWQISRQPACIYNKTSIILSRSLSLLFTPVDFDLIAQICGHTGKGGLGAGDINSLNLMNLSGSIIWADVRRVGPRGWVS